VLGCLLRADSSPCGLFVADAGGQRPDPRDDEVQASTLIQTTCPAKASSAIGSVLADASRVSLTLARSVAVVYQDCPDASFVTHWCVPAGRLQARLDGRRDVGCEPGGGVSGRALCVAGEEEGAASGSCRVREASDAQDRVTCGGWLYSGRDHHLHDLPQRAASNDVLRRSLVCAQGAGARGQALVVGERAAIYMHQRARH
jgi:hypothetical protein